MLKLSTGLRFFSNFVPKHSPPASYDVDSFKRFLNSYDNIVILSGAGVSTDSGIPDYRSEEVGVFARTNYKPIQYSDFVRKPDARKRFWARNFVGWPRFSGLSPNSVHHFVKSLEQFPQKIIGVITQNVDGLHSKAGSQNILELHGNAFWVTCLGCGDIFSRHDFQTELQNRNSSLKILNSELRPDGDVELNEDDVKDFEVPDCKKCGGILKPTIVFFGENVPEKRVEEVDKLIQRCDAMLVLGTSLSTLSSYRIVEEACDACKFICMVNIGDTRGDKLVDLRISCRISDLISELSHKHL